jgi:hypothetical protein
MGTPIHLLLGVYTHMSFQLCHLTHTRRPSLPLAVSEEDNMSPAPQSRDGWSSSASVSPDSANTVASRPVMSSSTVTTVLQSLSRKRSRKVRLHLCIFVCFLTSGSSCCQSWHQPCSTALPVLWPGQGEAHAPCRPLGLPLFWQRGQDPAQPGASICVLYRLLPRDTWLQPQRAPHPRICEPHCCRAELLQ